MNDSVAFITVKVACKHGNFGCDIWVRILRKYTCIILFIASSAQVTGLTSLHTNSPF